MGPRLVLVHGIGGPRDREADRARWVEALARGAEKAGHARFGVELLAGTGAEVVFASYHDLFVVPNAQGVTDLGLGDEELVLLGDFLNDLIGAQLEENHDDRTTAALNAAKARLNPIEMAQGAGDIVRRLLNAATCLLSIPPLGRAGQWLAAKILVRELAQVTRYLARREVDSAGHTLDQRIRERVRAALGHGPTIVVAHSLGTVVVLETLHEYPGRVPLLVTLGSPLGMRVAVWPNVRPQPPAVPDQVGKWLNFWDRDDIFVSRPRLENDVRPNVHGIKPVSARVDADGPWVHTATKYLAQSEVAGQIAAAVGELRGRASA